MLYSVNLLILGGKSLVAIDPRANQLLVHMSRNNGSILSRVIIAGITIFLLYEFFYTEIGLTLKSTGDNPDMSRAQGVDVNRNKVVGLAIANGIVAMAGALLAQYRVPPTSTTAVAPSSSVWPPSSSACPCPLRSSPIS